MSDRSNPQILPTRLFFVALRSEGGEGNQSIEVMKFEPKTMRYTDVRYQLPDGHLSYSWGPGEGGATIDVTTEKPGSQLIQVFVVGDTPWTSLSEYRVVDSTLHPLRHAHSAPWLLLGIPICLVLFDRLRKPIERGIKRLIRLESE